jgi:hypothetical protein
MRRKSYAALRDPELVDVLQNDPELLAIADAVNATGTFRRRRRSPRLLSAVVAAVAAVVVLSFVHWRGGSAGFESRALAAIGDGDVIHVRTEADVQGQFLVDLSSGREHPLVQETEIWFDRSRSLEHVVTRVEDRTVADDLETPTGWWTADGRIYTCRWIAAHPAEAVKAGVSCDGAQGQGRSGADETPVLDPALADFVTRYRDALQDGAAKRVGSGEVDGTPVVWLEFSPGDTHEIERVAVDQKTMRPVLVVLVVDGVTAATYRVTSIETISSGKADFSRPKPLSPGPTPLAGRVVDSHEASLPQASAALGRRLVSPGAAVEDVQLSSSWIEKLETDYGPATSGAAPTRVTGVALLYGTKPPVPHEGERYVLVREAVGRQMAYGPLPLIEPRAGELVVTPDDVTISPGPAHLTLWRGVLTADGLFVSIEATSKQLVLDAARSLSRESLASRP